MKNVIVTGAANGIGYYFVKQLLKDGNNVTVLDINTDNLDGLRKEYSTLYPMVCDVRNPMQISTCVRESVNRFGSVDTAVHNACRCMFDSMENTGEETYRDVFDVNYYGALHLTQAVIPYMKKRHGGRIIFTSSGVGVTGFVNISPYASSKGAVESLAKCLNLEYREDGITFHLFHPPLTRTKSSEPLPVPREFMADPEKVGAGLAKRMDKRAFVICHGFGQGLQTRMMYLFPVAMGRLLSKMTAGQARKAT